VLKTLSQVNSKKEVNWALSLAQTAMQFCVLIGKLRCREQKNIHDFL